jgi:hypothetical protein
MHRPEPCRPASTSTVQRSAVVPRHDNVTTTLSHAQCANIVSMSSLAKLIRNAALQIVAAVGLLAPAAVVPHMMWAVLSLEQRTSLHTGPVHKRADVQIKGSGIRS